MELTRTDVEHVAWLARLELTDEEIGSLTNHLNKLMGHFEKLKELDTQGVEPTSHSIPMQNVFREDKVGVCLTTEDAVSNAPEAENEYFIVPQVVET